MTIIVVRAIMILGAFSIVFLLITRGHKMHQKAITDSETNTSDFQRVTGLFMMIAGLFLLLLLCCGFGLVFIK